MLLLEQREPERGGARCGMVKHGYGVVGFADCCGLRRHTIVIG